MEKDSWNIKATNGGMREIGFMVDGLVRVDCPIARATFTRVI